MKRFVAGFTLIELLTVIAIIAIIAALLLPAVNASRERGNMALCASNLREVGKGLNLYADEHGDKLPQMNEKGTTSWVKEILPYLQDENKVFHCPSDTLTAPAGQVARTYAVNGIMAGAQGESTYMCPFSNKSSTQPMRLGDLDNNRGDIILVGERPGTNDASRATMDNYSCLSLDLIPGSIHQKGAGANYLMASWAVKYITVGDAKTIPEGNEGNLWTYFSK